MTGRKKLTPAVILVADRTLSADYKILFEGMFATMQTTHVPEFFMRHFLAPPVRVDDTGRAKTAPLGLRRVESSLIDSGVVNSEDVVCTTPEYLPELLGPWVKVVGFSSSDPLGMGMSNTTTKNFWKGELYTSFWTRRLLEEILEAKNKFGFTVVAGGAGAWQFKQYPTPAAEKCIDCFYLGNFESAGPQLFSSILSGQSFASFIESNDIAAEKIKTIKAASLLGIIELSRGCGRGCSFCTMASQKMHHLPIDTILADLQTNVSAGLTCVVSGSEDFFRYGSRGNKPDFDKLSELLIAMRRVKGLSFMQLDHANITTVAQLTDAQLTETKRLLTWDRPSRYLWLNMGLESANGHLVAANAPGKIAPFSPDDWPGLALQTAERLIRTGFFPVFSIILGLPGETGDDVLRTTKLIDRLGKTGAVIFPVFYEPTRPDQIKAGLRFSLEQMRCDHLALYSKCYEINFRLVPKLIWDNQRCAGVSLFKRAALQLLGKTEIVSWRRAFKKVGSAISLRTAEHGTYKDAG